MPNERREVFEEQSRRMPAYNSRTMIKLSFLDEVDITMEKIVLYVSFPELVENKKHPGNDYRLYFDFLSELTRVAGSVIVSPDMVNNYPSLVQSIVGVAVSHGIASKQDKAHDIDLRQ